mmetsp:Transcript_37374/g.111192  ORF Transcript_37374/g.111192 Transcript_37374/m.111192 type:complete len:360 (+) Transcript_37374:236-1315(+)
MSPVRPRRPMRKSARSLAGRSHTWFASVVARPCDWRLAEPVGPLRHGALLHLRVHAAALLVLHRGHHVGPQGGDVCVARPVLRGLRPEPRCLGAQRRLRHRPDGGLQLPLAVVRVAPPPIESSVGRRRGQVARDAAGVLVGLKVDPLLQRARRRPRQSLLAQHGCERVRQRVPVVRGVVLLLVIIVGSRLVEQPREPERIAAHRGARDAGCRRCRGLSRCRCLGRPRRCRRAAWGRRPVEQLVAPSEPGVGEREGESSHAELRDGGGLNICRTEHALPLPRQGDAADVFPLCHALANLRGRDGLHRGLGGVATPEARAGGVVVGGGARQRWLSHGSPARRLVLRLLERHRGRPVRRRPG